VDRDQLLADTKAFIEAETALGEEHLSLAALQRQHAEEARQRLDEGCQKARGRIAAWKRSFYAASHRGRSCGLPLIVRPN
jgi:hypothetical protein